MIPLVFVFALIGIMVVAVVLTEVEKFGWATALLLLTVVSFDFFHVLPVLEWVASHSTQSILLALVYVVVGVLWSFGKWFSFLIQFRDKFREQKVAFLTYKKLDTTGPIPALLLEEFQTQLYNGSRSRSRYSREGINALTDKPRASNNKARIVSWMSLWPCSMIGTLLNDPIRRVFNFLFNQFKNLYQKMSDHVLRNET